MNLHRHIRNDVINFYYLRRDGEHSGYRDHIPGRELLF